MPEDVTLEAHFKVDAQTDATRRLSIQEDIIAHMVKTVMNHGGPIDQETAEIQARRAYFLLVGFAQAARDFGVIKI